MYNGKASKIAEAGERLFTAREREAFPLWQCIADSFCPEDANFLSSPQWDRDFARHLFNTTGATASSGTVDDLSVMLQPDGREWFASSIRSQKKLADQEHSALQAHTEITKSLYNHPKSNSKYALKKIIGQLLRFGEYCVVIEPNAHNESEFKTGVGDPYLHFRVPHLSTIAYDIDAFDQVVEVHEKREERAIEHVEYWKQAGGKPSQLAVDAVERKLFDAKINMRRCIMPADRYKFVDERLYLVKKRNEAIYEGPQFAQVFYEATSGQIIHESIIPYNPFVIQRWERTFGTRWGLSPISMLALPLNRRLQQMSLSIIDTIERIADPAVMANYRAILGGDIDTSPGQVTWYDQDSAMGSNSVKPIEVIDTAGDPNVGLNFESVNDQRMREIWKTDSFDSEAVDRETAYGAGLRNEQFIRKALPLVGAFERLINGPLLMGISRVGAALGAYDEVFNALGGERHLTFDFQNPLRDAEGRRKYTGFQEMLELTMAAAQVDPSITKSIDWRKAHNDVLVSLKLTDWLVPQAELDEIMKQEAAQQAAAQKVAQAQEMAKVARDVSPAIASGAQLAQVPAAQADNPAIDMNALLGGIEGGQEEEILQLTDMASALGEGVDPLSPDATTGDQNVIDLLSGVE